MKNIIILVSLITILNMAAMNEPMHIEDRPCYLALLPIEILNAIAQYLPFDDIESEEEFVERTETTLKKPMPNDYKARFSQFFTGDSHEILTSFCCNEKKIALLNLLYGDNALPELLIVNSKKKEIVQQKKLVPLSYHHIAISNCGTLLATIDGQRTWEISYADLNDCVEKTTHTLTIQNLTNKETQEHSLNNLFWLADNYPDFSFDFNKEKNKIIIHANCYEQKTIGTKNIVSRSRHHTIIPVTVNTPATEPITKTFDHFCKQKWVCRQFALTYPHNPAFRPPLNN